MAETNSEPPQPSLLEKKMNKGGTTGGRRGLYERRTAHRPTGSA